MRLRAVVVLGLVLLLSLVVQTTLIAQLRYFVPDLVALIVILTALTRIRPEAVLGVAFVAGVTVDLVGSTLVGLRGVVYALVAYVALRTRDRAEIGRVFTALWAGGLTLLTVVLLVLIGLLFGEASVLGSQVMERLITIPLANALLAALLGPVLVRAVDRDTTALRFT
ncbi:MAG: rod shape-determining protein MreD [Acidimicrobiia bacterium]|nr:rod shape-determining protein MreD [Acidimicrobiia bacterium]